MIQYRIRRINPQCFAAFASKSRAPNLPVSDSDVATHPSSSAQSSLPTPAISRLPVPWALPHPAQQRPHIFFGTAAPNRPQIPYKPLSLCWISGAQSRILFIGVSFSYWLSDNGLSPHLIYERNPFSITIFVAYLHIYQSLALFRQLVFSGAPTPVVPAGHIDHGQIVIRLTDGCVSSHESLPSEKTNDRGMEAWNR